MWHGARLRNRQVVDEGLQIVRLDVPQAVSAGFHRPGTFQRIRWEGEESMFAVASSPGETTFEFLVRAGRGVSLALSSEPPGTTFEVTLPEGRGFQLDVASGRDLLMVCTGTALAPIRSTLGVMSKQRARFRRVTLLQGQRSPQQLPWHDELTQLPSVEVHTVVAEDAPGWTGHVGLVQERVGSLVTPNTVAFLVGQKEMTDAVSTILQGHGIDPRHILLNID